MWDPSISSRTTNPLSLFTKCNTLTALTYHARTQTYTWSNWQVSGYSSEDTTKGYPNLEVPDHALSEDFPTPKQYQCRVLYTTLTQGIIAIEGHENFLPRPHHACLITPTSTTISNQKWSYRPTNIRHLKINQQSSPTGDLSLWQSDIRLPTNVSDTVLTFWRPEIHRSYIPITSISTGLLEQHIPEYPY